MKPASSWHSWSSWSLSRRLSAVFAALLLACCGASAWLQMSASARQEREVTQRLSLGLAAHIAGTAELMQSGGLNPAAIGSQWRTTTAWPRSASCDPMNASS